MGSCHRGGTFKVGSAANGCDAVKIGTIYGEIKPVLAARGIRTPDGRAPDLVWSCCRGLGPAGQFRYYENSLRKAGVRADGTGNIPATPRALACKSSALRTRAGALFIGGAA